MKLTNKNIVGELKDRDIIDEELKTECQTNPLLCEEIVDAFKECMECDTYDLDEEEKAVVNDVRTKFLFARIMVYDRIITDFLYEHSITGTFDDQPNKDYMAISLYGDIIERFIKMINYIIQDIEDITENSDITNVPREYRNLISGYKDYYELLNKCQYDCIALGLEKEEDEPNNFKVSILDHFIQEHDTYDFGKFPSNYINQDNKKPTR